MRYSREKTAKEFHHSKRKRALGPFYAANCMSSGMSTVKFGCTFFFAVTHKTQNCSCGFRYSPSKSGREVIRLVVSKNLRPLNFTCIFVFVQGKNYKFMSSNKKRYNFTSRQSCKIPRQGRGRQCLVVNRRLKFLQSWFYCTCIKYTHRYTYDIYQACISCHA